jgi:hypothetical protein
MLPTRGAQPLESLIVRHSSSSLSASPATLLSDQPWTINPSISDSGRPYHIIGRVAEGDPIFGLKRTDPR